VRHVPHLVVAAPWDGDTLSLSVVQWRHVTKVLRLHRGDPVSYTDGLGTMGTGRLGNQSIDRGDEVSVARPSSLVMAVAPPSNKDRQRYLVEKLSELGVARLIWIKTAHGRERVSSAAKVFNWVLSGTEQSRGAWLMETSDEVLEIGELPGPVTFCSPGGGDGPNDGDIIVIGPEGGFADDEIPNDATTWDLGPTILRVETAAVAAAVILRSR
jgi:16S rRNA (uracil1498-N3)-methyltransferase